MTTSAATTKVKAKPKAKATSETDQLTSQMLQAGLSLGQRSGTGARTRTAALITVFQFPYARITRETLVDAEWGNELAYNLMDTQLEVRGLEATLDALILAACNRSCDQNMNAIEQAAWRRAAEGLCEARRVAKAGDL